MKIALIILGVIIALIVLLVIIGLLLPRDHVATRMARFRQPIESVWATITDHANEPTWRGDIKTKERLPDRDDKPVWRESRGRNDSITLMTLEMDPPRRMVGKIVDNSQFGGMWTYALAPTDDGGCTLAITENGEIYNPVFRVVARFIIGYQGTMDGYLASLSKKFGQPVEFIEPR